MYISFLISIFYDKPVVSRFQLQGLISDTPYTHSYCTMVKSQVLTLHLKDWAYLLNHFPLSRDIIYKTTSSDDFGSPPSRNSYKTFYKKSSLDKPSSTNKIDKGSPQTPPPKIDSEYKSSKFDVTPDPSHESSIMKVSRGISTINGIKTSENIIEDDRNIEISISRSQHDITLTPNDKTQSNQHSQDPIENVASTSKKVTEKDKEASVQYISSDQSINNNALLFNEIDETTDAANEKLIKMQLRNSESMITKVSDHINKDAETEEHVLTIDSKSEVNNLLQAGEQGNIQSDGPSELKQIQEHMANTDDVGKADPIDDDHTSIQSAKTNRRMVRVHYDNDKKADTSSEKLRLTSENIPDPEVLDIKSLDSGTHNMNHPEIDKNEEETKSAKSSSTSESDSSINRKHTRPSE